MMHAIPALRNLDYDESANGVIDAPHRHPRRRSLETPTKRSVDRVRQAFDASPDLTSAVHLDPEIVRWTYQAHSVPGCVCSERVVQHVPDFLVSYRDGSSAAIDVDGIVGFTPVDPTIRYIDAAVDMPLDATSRRNLRTIMSQVHREVSTNDRNRILRFVCDGAPKDLVSAATLATETSDPIATVLALVAGRFLDLDWRSRPIDCTTMIHLRDLGPDKSISLPTVGDRIPLIATIGTSSGLRT